MASYLEVKNKFLAGISYVWDMISTVVDWLLASVRHLPLVGGLPECRLVHYVESFKEIFVNFVLSTSPLWLGSLITFGIDTKRPKTFHEYVSALMQSFSGGEMLIYATAAIAPMFYFALITNTGKRDFPGRLSHIVCGLLIFMICTTLFGVQRSGVKIDPNFILPTALYIYGFSLTMIFIATTYRNWRGSADEVIQEAEVLPQNQERQFVDAAREHRDD